MRGTDPELCKFSSDPLKVDLASRPKGELVEKFHVDSHLHVHLCCIGTSLVHVA